MRSTPGDPGKSRLVTDRALTAEKMALGRRAMVSLEGADRTTVATGWLVSVQAQEILNAALQDNQRMRAVGNSGWT